MTNSIKTKLNFDHLISHLRKAQKDMDSSGTALVILQDGNVLKDWYSGYHSHQEASAKVDEHSQFNVASIRKTYIAFAVAFAIFQGKIHSIDDAIFKYLTEFKYQSLGDITIRHLLTHSHGLREQDNIFNRLFKAGTDWKYNNTGVNLLIKIVEITTGKKVSAILQNEAFQPLGFNETGWRTEKENHLIFNVYEESDVLGPYNSLGGEQSNLFSSARELAAWGQLFLNKGKLNGKQILSEELFEQMITIQSPDNLPEYLPKQGFLWWVKGEKHSPTNEIGDQVPKGSFQVLGLTGCACLVIPKYRVVAVRMFNQTSENQHPDFNYLNEIREFGDLVSQCFKDLEF